MKTDNLDAQLAAPPLILLVESDRLQALQTGSALERSGFSVVTQASGLMALEFVRRCKPDLVLIDTHLPDMNGREVAQQLKGDPLLSGIPLIFLTSTSREVKDIIDGLEEGAHDYLLKPIEDGELVARVTAALRVRKTQRELARLARMLYTVNQVGHQLAGILNLEELLTSVVRLIKENFDYPHVHVYLRQEDELILAAAVDYPLRGNPLVAKSPRFSLHSNSPAALTVRTGNPQLLTKKDFENEPHPFLTKVQSGMTAPVHSAMEVSGVLEIASPVALAFSPNDRLVLQTLADLVGVAVHNSKMYQELTTWATKDELTGLMNRRSVFTQLEAELARSQSEGHNLSLIMVDIDAFKQVNDLFGHLAGDVALRAVADCIQHTIRRNDVAGRIGGEEFLIILPEINRKGATIIAERLRRACENMQVAVEGSRNIRLTISLGVASWPETAVKEATNLVSAVDSALYQAKNNGRNVVAVYHNNHHTIPQHRVNLISEASSL